MKFALVLWLSCLAATASSKRDLSDYPFHASTPDFDIGVEYTVHSYAGDPDKSDGQMYLANGFLVFDIALFPKHPVQLNDGAFELSVNNSKRPIPQIQPEFVASQIHNADWNLHPHLEADADIGNAGVSLGRPERVERFPGDPTARRLPAPPHAPENERNPKTVNVDPARLAIESALSPGLLTTRRSGNIYFPYTSNAARIKHLVLHLSIGSQMVDLPLR